MRLPTSNRLAAAAAVVAAASGSLALCGAPAQAATAQPGTAGVAEVGGFGDQGSCGTSATEYPGTMYGVVDNAESLTFERGGVLTLDSAAGPDVARSSGRYTVDENGVTIAIEGEKTTSAFRGCDHGTTPDVLFFPIDYSGLILVREPGTPTAPEPTSVLGQVDPDEGPLAW